MMPPSRWWASQAVTEIHRGHARDHDEAAMSVGSAGLFAMVEPRQDELSQEPLQSYTSATTPRRLLICGTFASMASAWLTATNASARAAVAKVRHRGLQPCGRFDDYYGGTRGRCPAACWAMT